MNQTERRIYNREKQRMYRDIQRGRPARPYKKSPTYGMTIEEIMKAAGHCGFCGCLLTSEWHDKHPLVGCMRYIAEYKGRVLGTSDSPKV